MFSEKPLRSVERWEVVLCLLTQGNLPVQQACQAVRLSRATYYQPLVDWARREAAVIEALTTLGILEIRGSTVEYGRSVEPYTPLARLLSASAESSALDQEAGPGSNGPATRCDPVAEYELGAGPHARYVYCGWRFRTFSILDEGVQKSQRSKWTRRYPPNGSFVYWSKSPPGGASRRRFGSTMAQNSSPTALRVGARTEGSHCGIFSRTNRISLPAWNGSIGPSATRGLTSTCSSLWSR